MKVSCPFCDAQTDLGAELPARLRCRSCHCIVTLPSGARADLVRGEEPGPQVVLLAKAGDPAWVLEAAWTRILKKRAVGLSAAAIAQGWTAYAALRKPAPIPADFGTMHPLDGPAPSLCILCEVSNQCPRCKPAPDFIARRAALYRENAAEELCALVLASDELAEARLVAGHPEEPSLIAAATALCSGQPRRAVALAPADRLGPWLRARALMGSGRHAEAVPLLTQFQGPAARYLEACARASAGEAKPAHQQLSEIYGSDAPASLRWRAALSLCLLERKDPRPLARSCPRDPAAKILLARALLVTKQIGPAVELLPDDTPHAEVLLWRGHVLALARRFEEALAVYERVVEQAPGHEEALVALAYTALKCGQPARALTTEVDPNSPNVRFDYFQALCRMKAGRAGEAVPQLVNVSRRTQDPAVKKTIQTLQRQRGQSLFARGRYNEAIGTWKAAGGADDPAFRARIAEAYLRLGADGLKTRKIDEAQRALEQAVALRGSPADHFYHGLMELAGGRPAGAAASFEKAGELGPRARAHHAIALFADRQNDKAVKIAAQLTAPRDDREAALSDWVRAMVLIAGKDNPGAAALMKQLHESPTATGLFPSARQMVRKLRRRLARSQGDPLDGLDSTTGVPGLLSSVDASQLFSAIANYQAGRPADARNLLRSAIKSGVEQGEARTLLETLYGLWTLDLVRAGQIDEAAKRCAEAAAEGVEGDWARWEVGVKLDGRLKRSQPWDVASAKAAVGALEAMMPDLAKSAAAAELMPPVRHALAILSHKLAIELEENDKSVDAEPYWIRSTNAWLYLHRTGELGKRVRALAAAQFGEVDEAEVKAALDDLLRVEGIVPLLDYRRHYSTKGQRDRASFISRVLEPVLVWIVDNEPDDTRSPFELGMLYFSISATELASDHFEECSALLAKAVELAPEYEMIYRAIGTVHVQWAMQEMSKQNMAAAAELIEIAAAADPWSESAMRLREQLATFRRAESSRTVEIMRYRKGRDRIRWYSIGIESFGEDVWRAVADMIRRNMTDRAIAERLMQHSGFEGYELENLMVLIGKQRAGTLRGGLR